MAHVKLQTKKLGEIFQLNPSPGNIDFQLTIPDYQRAYEWKTYHVKNLLDDTYKASLKKKPYRMGTIILHQTNGKDNGQEVYEIVDGQQRLLTLTILLNCLFELSESIVYQELTLLYSTFDNNKSFYYVKNAKKEVESFLNGKNEQQKNEYFKFIIETLDFTVLIVSGENALDQAYTFFDSLNSKGKGLNDFELLKAHHLMFIPEDEESLAIKHNTYWLEKDDQKHKDLFSSILRRIRMWSRGKDRDDLSDRNDFYEFISAVEPNEIEQKEHLFNRYMQPNVFRSWHRENDEVVLNMKYPQHNMEILLPMEIPQTIEGGDSFFLYAKRYHEMFDLLFVNTEKKSSAITFANEIAKSIKNDYLSMAFKAVILLYFDKFGEQRLIEVATCSELIISEIRFRWRDDVKSTRPSPVRIESTLSWIKKKDLISIVLNSTFSSHVIFQMDAATSSIPRDSRYKDSKTLNDYYNSINGFYKNNKSKIKNQQITEKVNNIYNLI
jgi:uncharacterized protein with ParB-like and HNH nuclease domain